MSISVGGLNFDGPYSSSDSLRHQAGVYAILDRRTDVDYLIDVGESKNVRNRVDNHDRKPCWQMNCRGSFMVAVFYTPGLNEADRVAIEQEIRRQYNLPCGER